MVMLCTVIVDGAGGKTRRTPTNQDDFQVAKYLLKHKDSIKVEIIRFHSLLEHGNESPASERRKTTS